MCGGVTNRESGFRFRFVSCVRARRSCASSIHKVLSRCSARRDAKHQKSKLEASALSLSLKLQIWSGWSGLSLVLQSFRLRFWREWFRGGPARQRQPPRPPKCSFCCIAVFSALQFFLHLVWLVWLVGFELSLAALA